MRCRWPSITLKWTRTVSPALNFGMLSRNCARSSVSITLLIRGGPEGRGGILAKEGLSGSEPLASSVEGDPVRRPVGREDLADQVLPRHQAPAAGVAGRAS